MRKRVCVAVLAMMAITAIAFAALAMIPRPGITRSNFDRIQLGMQQPEVEAILGEPSKMYVDFDGRMSATWKSYECMIVVTFVDDCLAAKECGEGYQDERIAWEKVLALVWRQDPPTPFYIRSSTMYFPPAPPYPLPKELESLEEAQRQLDDERER